MGFVEPMDFIDEQDSLSTVETPLTLRLLDHLPYLLHPRQNGAEGNEMRIRYGGNNPGEGCLTRTGRSPKDHRLKLIRFDSIPEGLPFAQEMLLAKELQKRGRPHPIGQGCKGLPDFLRLRIE